MHLKPLKFEARNPKFETILNAKMRNPEHCCLENLNLKFVSDFENSDFGFRFHVLSGLIYFHASGFADRISSQGIQVSVDEPIRIFPEAFGPTPSRACVLLRRGCSRHPAWLPCKVLPSPLSCPLGDSIHTQSSSADPEPFRCLRIDLHPGLPSLK